MLALLMRFLPPDKQALLQLGMSVTRNLDSDDERRQVAEYGISMLRDGRISVREWSHLGKLLGVFGRENGDR